MKKTKKLNTLKTKKAIIKRIKITKSGLFLHRATNQDHFRAKLTGKQRRHKRKLMPISIKDIKAIKKFLFKI